MLAEIVLSKLMNECLLDPSKPVLLGLSGGPDSLSLLHILTSAEIEVIAAHLDHMLRPASTDEADFVEAYCKDMGVTCVRTQMDVSKFADELHLSIEEAARECRYTFFFEQARKLGAQAVITGHNADDQVETVLMHLLRGSGMSGLSGMKVVEPNPHWQADIPLWRPMLGVYREAILEYCENNQLSPIMDESNQDVKYFRNQLRHEVIPMLEGVNLQIKGILLRTAEVISADDDLLNQITGEIWDACVESSSSRWTIIDRNAFNAQPLSLRRRLLRKAITYFRPGLRDIGFEVIERHLLSLANSRKGSKRYDLANGLDIYIEDSVFTIIEHGDRLPEIDLPQLIHSHAYPLNRDASLILANGWVMHAMLINQEDLSSVAPALLTNPNHAWLAADDLKFSLLVRGRKAGDAWQPMGLAGHTQKLSDFFINEKVPLKARQHWPLVTSAEDIIWVTGFRPSEGFSLNGSESQILHLWIDKVLI